MIGSEQFSELWQQKGKAKQEKASRKGRHSNRAAETKERKSAHYETALTCEIAGCATAVGIGRKSGLCREHEREGLDLFFASEGDQKVFPRVERWVDMGFTPIEIGRLLLQEKYRQGEKPK